jgi:hypothetical protein
MIRVTLLMSWIAVAACASKPAASSDLPDVGDEPLPTEDDGGWAPDPDEEDAGLLADGAPAPRTDGGRLPAPGVDAPTVAVGGPVQPCKFKFCESFETVAVGAAPDPKIWRRAGNIVVESGRAARGTKAMRVRAGATPTETYISEAKVLPTMGEAFYARVFMYIEQRPVDFFHWSFTEVRGIDLRGPAPRYGGISTGAAGCAPPSYKCRDNFFFQIKPLVYGASEGGGASDDLRPVIPEKTWHCIEWYMNGKTREARLWWNGQERPRATYTDGKQIAFPAFNRFYLGWALYQTGTSGVGWDVWFDELAIHDQRIGCD